MRKCTQRRLLAIASLLAACGADPVVDSPGSSEIELGDKADDPNAPVCAENGHWPLSSSGGRASASAPSGSTGGRSTSAPFLPGTSSQPSSPGGLVLPQPAQLSSWNRTSALWPASARSRVTVLIDHEDPNTFTAYLVDPAAAKVVAGWTGSRRSDYAWFLRRITEEMISYALDNGPGTVGNWGITAAGIKKPPPPPGGPIGGEQRYRAWLLETAARSLDASSRCRI